MPRRARDRERPARDEPPEPARRGPEFGFGEQRTQVFRFAAGLLQPRGGRLEVGEQLWRDRLAGPVPDDAAQLLLLVEAEAVVDAPDVPGGVEQAVAALAVGVVGDGIEQAEPLELRPEGRVFALDEEVALRVVLDEELDRADAGRTLADDRRRDDWPAEEFREAVGGRLPAVEGAVGEVSERRFAVTRLVDGEEVAAPAAELCEEDVVRGVPDRAAAGELRVQQLRFHRLEVGSVHPVRA